MSDVIKQKILCKVRNSHFYGIMIDKSTDINLTDHLVVFATIIEEDVSLIVFLGLFKIKGGKNAIIIFECLVNRLRIWKLDLCKCVTFSSDGEITILGAHGGIVTRLKKPPKLIFILILCCS